MTKNSSGSAKREPLPFTKATMGDGGRPEGRVTGDKRVPGGRHNGALLSDPETTEERREKEVLKPKR